jgi:L-ascorbate metabolism protein UlaG (beta-lactamase superfamily)
MKITCYGHSCFEIRTKGLTFLFDPFISPNPATKGIVDVADLKPDYIFLSHGHGDHVMDAETVAKNSGAIIVSNYEITTWYEAKGITKTIGMNIGGNLALPEGKIKWTNAIHSSTLPDGTPGGNPAGLVYSGGEKTFYYAGDTALTMDMQLIGDQFDLDFAILPIGDHFTMGPEDALLCADMIRCNKIIGMHFNTFPPITIDTEKAIGMFAARGKELICMNIGDSLEI